MNTDIFNQLKLQKPLTDDGLVTFRREDFEALRYNYYCLVSETRKNPKASEYLRGYHSVIAVPDDWHGGDKVTVRISKITN